MALNFDRYTDRPNVYGYLMVTNENADELIKWVATRYKMIKATKLATGVNFYFADTDTSKVALWGQYIKTGYDGVGWMRIEVNVPLEKMGQAVNSFDTDYVINPRSGGNIDIGIQT